MVIFKRREVLLLDHSRESPSKIYKWHIFLRDVFCQLTTSIRGFGHLETADLRHDSRYVHCSPHHVHLYLALLGVTHNEQSGWPLWEPKISHLYSVKFIVSKWWFSFQITVTLPSYSPTWLLYASYKTYTEWESESKQIKILNITCILEGKSFLWQH